MHGKYLLACMQMYNCVHGLNYISQYEYTRNVTIQINKHVYVN